MDIIYFAIIFVVIFNICIFIWAIEFFIYMEQAMKEIKNGLFGYMKN